MGLNFDKLVLGPCVSAFGRRVTYRPLASAPGVAAFAVSGIFEAEHEMIERRDGADHSSVAPVLAVRLSAFAVPPRAGDEIVIGAETYQVWDPRPDGEGKLDLILRLA
jgi:hypothetical protein